MLTFHIEWLNGEGVPPPEISATFGRLEIIFDAEKHRIPLTQHWIEATDEVQNALYTSLYPLAQFLVDNWWRILYEPDREDLDIKFRNHHSLFYASRGFPYPDITIGEFDRDHISIEAEQRTLIFSGIEFLRSVPESLIPKALFEDCLAGLLAKVTDRLASEGLNETHLSKAWNAIKSLTSEEREFCAFAGRFGLNPFQISEEDERRLLEATSRLDRFDIYDLAGVLEWTSIEPELHDLEIALDSARNDSRPVSIELKHLREVGGCPPDRLFPHEQGVWLASRLRESLGYAFDERVEPDYLFQSLQIPVRTQPMEHLEARIHSVLYCGESVGGVLSEASKATSGRFSNARALCELISGNSVARTVNRGHTSAQRKNRAFAAELLAPVESLRARITTASISWESVSRLADEFGVDAQLIAHQVENAKIARVASFTA